MDAGPLIPFSCLPFTFSNYRLPPLHTHRRECHWPHNYGTLIDCVVPISSNLFLYVFPTSPPLPSNPTISPEPLRASYTCDFLR